jgi:2-polyprenyl-3-methyl-5-hydroxy-6-metoxy-1,4-benzoquinol methylase
MILEMEWITSMSEIVNFCPLCGGQSRPFNRQKFRGRDVINRVCRHCGLVYQSPRMSEVDAAEFYQAEYRQVYQGNENPIAKDFTTQTARAESLVGFVRTYVTSVSRHLDIGCSTGLILQHFNKEYGCYPVGIEPGDAYRDYASQQGLKVYKTLDELERAKEARFDLISMSHVLEHLPDPVGYLTHLREGLLESKGWLLLEVPNLYAHDSFEIAHLVSFSTHTLTQTAEKAGFEIVKQERHGRPRSQLLPLYITVLARPNASKIHKPHPEKNVAFKRWAGMFRRRLLERFIPGKAWVDVNTR